MMSRVIVFALALVFVSSQCLWAADPEVESLTKRVEELEERLDGQVVTGEPGHRRVHPVHSVYGLSVSGSITFTAHGASDSNGAGQVGEAALSADLAIESPVGENGRAVLVFDFQKGEGMQNLPGFFTAPNGNPTGYNADIESFDDTRLNVTQVYYEHDINEGLTVSVGQLDITGYFDANEYANDERSQFLANVFVNNPTVEWGGSGDFYGPGLRLTWAPSEKIGLTVGAFEGDGDYENTFDNPFLMAEAGFALSPMGRNGNYRVYYWHRGKRPEADPANTADPGDPGLFLARNSGAGISIDQGLTENVGVWLRAGLQREKVAQFDRFAGAGVHVSGEAFGRPHDHMGLGYAATFTGDTYKDYTETDDPAFDAGTEHYLELYYSHALNDSPPDRGFHITPDLQYVINPGGNVNASDLFIYGVRLQTYF